MDVKDAISHIDKTATIGENVAAMQQLYGLTKEEAEILVKGIAVGMAFVKACQDLKTKR